jgi:hypothetical protein
VVLLTKGHTTLYVDKELVEQAQAAKINCSQALEEVLRIKLGLDSDLTKITNREQQLQQELEMLQKQKLKITEEVKVKATKSQTEAATQVMLRAWKRRGQGEFNYFAKVLRIFCEKYGFEKWAVLDFLEGKRKDLPFGSPGEPTPSEVVEVVGSASV